MIRQQNKTTTRDEATSALDADTEKRLLQNLRSMTDKTVRHIDLRYYAICFAKLINPKGDQ